MSNIQSYFDRLPENKNLGLEKIIFERLDADLDSIELKIVVDDENINIKELSAYLDFIYQIDGQLSPLNFNSYSKTPRRQIEISQIKQGSWQLIIEKLLETIDGQNLMILYLVLKFFPTVVTAALDGIHKYYEIQNSREDFIKKKSDRKRKVPLKKVISQDESLKSVSEKDKAKIQKLISKFYKEENLAASRFAQKYIKKIELTPKKKNSR